MLLPPEQVPKPAWHPVPQWAVELPQYPLDEQHVDSGHFLSAPQVPSVLTVNPVEGVPVEMEPAADEVGRVLVARVVPTGDPVLVTNENPEVDELAIGIPGLAEDAGASGAACSGTGAPPGVAEPQFPVVELSSPVPTTSGPGFGYLGSFPPTVLHPVPMFAMNMAGLAEKATDGVGPDPVVISMAAQL